MLVAFLMFESGDHILEREATVDHRLQAIGVNGADHVDLLAAAADQDRVQTQLPQ